MITDDRFGVRAPARLSDVARLGLDREAERLYLQDIVESVAERLDTTFAVIDILLDDAQVFLASSGPVPKWMGEAGGTPIEWSFCRPLITERVPRTVVDLAEDDMFRDNPLVTRGLVRSYAGAPLISYRGEVLGGLCGLDIRPRGFGPRETAYLQRMAIQVVERIEARSPAN